MMCSHFSTCNIDPRKGGPGKDGAPDMEALMAMMGKGGGGGKGGAGGGGMDMEAKLYLERDIRPLKVAWTRPHVYSDKRRV